MKQQLAKIKKHLSDNKVAYVSGGVGILVGAAGMMIVGSASDIKAVQEVFAPLSWKPTITQTQITTLIRRGHPGNLIMCDQTGVQFASQNHAAELMNLSPTNLSQHLNGKQPSVGGFTFTKTGEMA